MFVSKAGLHVLCSWLLGLPRSFKGTNVSSIQTLVNYSLKMFYNNGPDLIEMVNNTKICNQIVGIGPKSLVVSSQRKKIRNCFAQSAVMTLV
jgi:hypothetical protein